MTAASSQSVDLDEQRAELKSVLGSAHFARAPKLAQFLTYLCEKLFAGESARIKEYSIGLDVFQRGENFDQNSDSIVRVEAGRLRSKLREYYDELGSSDRVYIELPKRTYAVRIRKASGKASIAARIFSDAAGRALPPGRVRPDR